MFFGLEDLVLLIVKYLFISSERYSLFLLSTIRGGDQFIQEHFSYPAPAVFNWREVARFNLLWTRAF